MTCPLLNKLVENRRGVALAYREKGVAHSPNPEISPKTFGVGTNHLNGLCFQITPPWVKLHGANLVDAPCSFGIGGI